MSHPLTWLYRKLGRHYPAVFITVDLATAFVVGTGAVALFSFYYSVSRGDFVKILAITLGLTAVSIAVLGLSWLAFFPIMIAALLSVGYAGIVHYLALELALRPILFDINAALDKPVRIDRPVVPLRIKLLGSLPLINVITGVVVAALTSDGGGTDALGINVLIALTVSFTVSFELTVLLSRSILRPVEH